MLRLQDMSLAQNLSDIAVALRERHGCHTAILYGSHASGDSNSDSDYDVAGFAGSPAARRIAGRWRDSYLDLFIYPDSKLSAPSPELIHLRDGLILFEQQGAATSFLKALDEMYLRGPEPLGPDEVRVRRRWAWKMVDRARRQDLEGSFRRSWLETELLEDYFRVRQMWYLGPKKSFAYLRSNAPTVYAAFERALRPDADIEALAHLVECVAGQRDDHGLEEELLRTHRQELRDV